MRLTVGFLLSFLSVQAMAQYTTPTKLSTAQLTFADDLDFAWLDLALDRQITSFQAGDLTGTIKLGDRKSVV